MYNKVQVKGNIGHLVQICVCRLPPSQRSSVLRCRSLVLAVTDVPVAISFPEAALQLQLGLAL